MLGDSLANWMERSHCAPDGLLFCCSTSFPPGQKASCPSELHQMKLDKLWNVSWSLFVYFLSTMALCVSWQSHAVFVFWLCTGWLWEQVTPSYHHFLLPRSLTADYQHRLLPDFRPTFGIYGAICLSCEQWGKDALVIRALPQRRLLASWSVGVQMVSEHMPQVPCGLLGNVFLCTAFLMKEAWGLLI